MKILVADISKQGRREKGIFRHNSSIYTWVGEVEDGLRGGEGGGEKDQHKDGKGVEIYVIR